MVGIIEEEEEIEKAAKTALDLEKKRNNEELSAQISKINFMVNVETSRLNSLNLENFSLNIENKIF